MAARLGPVEPWVFHDLRRTSATGMADLGIAPHVLDRVLNHVSGTIKGVARIYNRSEYAAERIEALNIWARHVEEWFTPSGFSVANSPSPTPGPKGEVAP